MKGLLMIPAMAQAACVGTKTETRRVIVPQPMTVAVRVEHFRGKEWQAKIADPDIKGLTLYLGSHNCDYVAGERRCLLTTWAVPTVFDGQKPTEIGEMLTDDGIAFWHAGMPAREPPVGFGKRRAGRFLPNTMRHLMPVFEIVSVRAERVQDINEAGAIAEGCSSAHGAIGTDDLIVGTVVDRLRCGWPFARYVVLWDSINAKRGPDKAKSGYGWSFNPWVFVVQFRRVQS